MTDVTLWKMATALGIWLGSLLVAIALFKSVGYRLTETHLLITLFRIPIRRVPIQDIRHMGFEPRGWAERWYNTFTPAGRRLVIRRRTGLMSKTLIITPENPFGMMHDIQKAKDKLKSVKEPASV